LKGALKSQDPFVLKQTEPSSWSMAPMKIPQTINADGMLKPALNILELSNILGLRRSKNKQLHHSLMLDQRRLERASPLLYQITRV
jgi:hypothetical protein